ncbi:hypothetical protein BGW38_006471, partial [Lunasporangiospora selenospora]
PSRSIGSVEGPLSDIDALVMSKEKKRKHAQPTPSGESHRHSSVQSSVLDGQDHLPSRKRDRHAGLNESQLQDAHDNNAPRDKSMVERNSRFKAEAGNSAASDVAVKPEESRKEKKKKRKTRDESTHTANRPLAMDTFTTEPSHSQEKPTDKRSATTEPLSSLPQPKDTTGSYPVGATAKDDPATTVARKQLSTITITSPFVPRQVLLSKKSPGALTRLPTATGFSSKKSAPVSGPVSSTSKEESTSPSKPIVDEKQTSTEAVPLSNRSVSQDLQQAQPLVVYNSGPRGGYDYPYGNYPSYYHKRAREQSGSSANVSKDKHQGYYGYQEGEQPVQRPRRFIKSTSVLFPAHDSTWSQGSTNPPAKKSRTPRRQYPTLHQLAKSVDLRLEFLDRTWFEQKRVLDIGCNSGLITVFLAVHYRPQQIQGVDVDPSLISKARQFVLKTFSQISRDAYLQQGPGLIEKAGVDMEQKVKEEEEEEKESGCHSKASKKQDRKDKKKKKSKSKDKDADGSSSIKIRDSNNDRCQASKEISYEAYFPNALHKIHGYLEVPERTLETQHLFPHNLELRVADWAVETEADAPLDQGAGKWDVILGFSLTKWIHLHQGDEGLKAFFRKVYRSLAPGGIFLMEPQAYKTYAKRSKITPEMRRTYESITFRPEQFQEYLLSSSVGFREAVTLGQSEGCAGNFNRTIVLFRK